MDTHPLCDPKQVPRSHQVLSVSSRGRIGAEVHVAQLGGNQLSWLVSGIQGSEPLVRQAKEGELFPPTKLDQSATESGQGTKELCRCEHSMMYVGQVLLKGFQLIKSKSTPSRGDF